MQVEKSICVFSGQATRGVRGTQFCMDFPFNTLWQINFVAMYSIFAVKGGRKKGHQNVEKFLAFVIR